MHDRPALAGGAGVALTRAFLVGRRTLNQLGLRRRKVFCVGFNKTGTSSLHTLFESLGLPSFHGPEWRACDDPRLLRTYDCFSDGVPRDLMLLDGGFRGAKFILQVRDLDSWVYSRLAHVEREKASCTHVAGDPGWDATEEAVTGWVVRRNAHHRNVLAHFAERTGDLLVVNFIRDAGAATRVSRFLGMRRERARPARNVHVTDAPPARHADLLERSLARLGVPADERHRDILCESLLDPADRGRYPADTNLLPGTAWAPDGTGGA